MSMPDSARFFRPSAASRRAAAEQCLERFAEIGVDGIEGLGESLAGYSTSISWMAFSVSRMESSRSCRCTFRNSWRCCAS